MSNNVVQPQGKRLTCQERLQHIPNFSVNTIFIYLTDVKFHSSFFQETKTESDKKNYILFSQSFEEALEMLLARVNCVSIQELRLFFKTAKGQPFVSVLFISDKENKQPYLHR